MPPDKSYEGGIVLEGLSIWTTAPGATAVMVRDCVIHLAIQIRCRPRLWPVVRWLLDRMVMR